MKSPEYVAIVTRTYRKYIDLFDRLVREHGEEAARDMYSVDEDDMLELRQIFNRGDFTEGYIDGNPGEDILSGASPKNQGLYLGRVIAVIDSEDKVSEKDERSAARGALRRGKELVCIGLDSSAKELGIGIENSDGLEFRSEDRDYLVNSPVGNVCTYIKDLGDGCILAGDFDRGVMTGDLAFKVTDRKLMDKALDAPERKLPATIQFTAREGQFPVLVMTDVRADCSVETVADHRIERAEKAATDPERVENSLRRLGDTVYDPGLTGIDIQMDEGIMMPLSVVNRMRREAADELLEKRLSSAVSGRSPKLSKERIEEVKEAEGLGTSVLDTAAMERRLKKSGRQPVPVEEFMKIRDEGGELPEGVLPYILNISRGNLDAFIKSRFGDIAEACRDTGILIGNTGWIERFSEAGVKVYGDYGLNVYNRQAELAYEELGAELYMPSHETGISDGRGIPLMVTEHPVSASALTDRKGVVHKVAVPPSGDKTLIY
jgi:putative protease